MTDLSDQLTAGTLVVLVVFASTITIATATSAIAAPQSSFQVSNLTAPASATQGEMITVNATITNDGNTTDNTTVAYRFNGTEQTNITVELGAGNSTNVSFTFDTTGVSTGSYSHGVYTADDNQTATIDIVAPASFGVSGLDAPGNVTQNETILVNATITNTGGTAGSATVEYRFNGTEQANTTVSLDAGNATDVTFMFDTTGVSTGGYIHGVFTGDNNQTAEITIEETDDGEGTDEGQDTAPGPKQGPPPADMAAWKNTQPIPGNQATPSSLGGKIRVEKQYRSATSIELVRNTSTDYTLNITVTGDASNVTFFLQKQAVAASQNISNVTMYLDGQPHVFYDEAAGPGNSPWILFEIGHFSTRQISFQSTATQANNATFEVSGLSAPANATQGESITVNATVTNTGNTSGQASVDYRFNGTQRSSTSVSLDVGNATDVEFTFDTSGVMPGTYTHGVFTTDDNQTAEISIEGADKEDADKNATDDGNESTDDSDSSGPKQGPPPANIAAFTQTAPLTESQTTPSSLSGKIRVEQSVKANTSIELVKNTSSNYTLRITVTGNATNVTFFLQRQAVESSQNISNVTMYLDGQKHIFYDTAAGPGNSPWLLFEIDHFSTRTVSFESTSTTNQTVSEAIAGSDGVIGLTDIQQAIQYWATGESVPDTGGKTIGITTIQQLIQTWASGG